MHMNENIDVSIIIVSYNTRAKTHRCIQSIIDNTVDIKYEIIVSDNGSNDGSVEDIKASFLDVILIENHENLGFGRANNIGLDYARGRFVFYLNSDTYLLNNGIKVLYDYWIEHEGEERIGAIGGQLLDSERKYTHSGADFPSYRNFCTAQFKSFFICIIKAIFHSLKKDRQYYAYIRKKKICCEEQSQIGYIGYVTGADLFVENNEMARFNEEYFMYCEETELELKLARNGLKRLIIDGTEIVHDQSKEHETEIKVYRASDYYKEKSSLVYCRNNLKKKPVMLSFLIKLNGINPYVRRVRTEIESC